MFLEMLEFKLQHLQENARNSLKKMLKLKKPTFDLSWAYMSINNVMCISCRSSGVIIFGIQFVGLKIITQIATPELLPELLGVIHKPCSHFFHNFDPLPPSSQTCTF